MNDMKNKEMAELETTSLDQIAGGQFATQADLDGVRHDIDSLYRWDFDDDADELVAKVNEEKSKDRLVTLDEFYNELYPNRNKG